MTKMFESDTEQKSKQVQYVYYCGHSPSKEEYCQYCGCVWQRVALQTVEETDAEQGYKYD